MTTEAQLQLLGLTSEEREKYLAALEKAKKTLNPREFLLVIDQITQRMREKDAGSIQKVLP